MISEQAKEGLERIFERAIVANFRRDAGDSVRVDALPALPDGGKNENSMLVLTIVSYFFRLLTIFHVNNDKTTRDYFAGTATESKLGEVLCEIGNLSCGAMNRELGKLFMHTGMSTPDLLQDQCFGFLDELKPSFVSRHRIVINDAVFIDATLCLCAYSPIDFCVGKEEAPEETGLLELF